MSLRIKHLLHSSAVRYGEIFHSPSACEISHADSCNKLYACAENNYQGEGMGMLQMPVDWGCGSLYQGERVEMLQL